MKDDQMVTADTPYEGKKKKEKLSSCTSAASAEHSRAYDDAPCDDGREGNVD